MEIEKNILSSIKNEPLRVEVEILKPSLIQKIRKISKRVYFVRALTLSKLIDMTKYLLDIPEYDYKENENIPIPELIKIVSEHGDKIIKITSIVLEEKEDFIKDNFSAKELFDFFMSILSLADFQSFFFTIVLTRAKTSLKA